MNNRILYLDFLRVLACFMVVVMHSPIANEMANDNGPFLSSLSYFTAPCIGLLFMISGALLLPVSEKFDAISFLKKRLTKVLFPTLFWTVFYLSLKTLDSGFSIDTLKQLMSIPFSAQGHGILWFMYTLIGLYLLAPILSYWLRNISKRELQFYLGLWGISLCYPILENILVVQQSTAGILYYFTGYVGYFLLGYYMKHYGECLKYKFVILAFAIAVAAPVAVKILGLEVDFYRVFWYLSIFVVALCIFWWRTIEKGCAKMKISDQFQQYIVLLSNLTFGIYLSHIFIMRNMLWNVDLISSMDNYIFQTIVIAFLTFMCAALLSWGISILPFGDYIIGFKRKRR